MKRSSSPALRLGSVAFIFGTATTFFAAGCGAGASTNPGLMDGKATSAMAPQEPPAPLNVAEAEAQLALAERNVFGAFGRDKPEGQFAQPPGQPLAQGSVAAESSPPPPPRGEDRVAKDGDRGLAAGAAPVSPQYDSASSSPCETACRALASMNRAATHLCNLAGQESESCSNARERLRAATERVRQSCSECAG
jgi:hypothetical protein